MENLEVKIDKQEQYSRRNGLLIYDISENKDEDTDYLVTKTLKSDMNIDMKIEQIDRMHIIGSFKKDGGNKKCRLIMVNFVQYANRCKVFVNKNVLKGKNISITESLTKERMRKLKESKEQNGFKRVSTIDEKILFKEDDSPSTMPKVYCE